MGNPEGIGIHVLNRYKIKLINPFRFKGGRDHEVPLTSSEWKDDVPKTVFEIIDEIGGVKRLQDLSKTDEDSI